ncbi:hypothetical protein PtB15_7B235 [Puccinia triticina]|nr:hypothetical protein PtB15_7B235 [Puccinia triticina]
MQRLFFERIGKPLPEPVAEQVAAMLINCNQYTNWPAALGSEFTAIATRIIPHLKTTPAMVLLPTTPAFYCN